MSVISKVRIAESPLSQYDSNTILSEFKNKYSELSFKQINKDVYKQQLDWEDQG